MSSGYREFDDFATGTDSLVNNRKLSDVATNVQHFCKNVSTLEDKTDDIDTRRDTPDLREEVILLVADTAQLAKITNTSVKKIRLQSKQLGTNDRVQFEGLMTKFASAGNKFQRIQKLVADLKQEMISQSRIPRQRAPSSSDTAGSAPSVAGYGDSSPFAGQDALELSYEERSRQEAQLQAEATADATMLEAREHDMHQLEHDIVDINDIFRDLGTMVHDQGEIVDHIEANVEGASARVERGNAQLSSAVTAKRWSRKLVVVIVVILVLVGVAVIIVALITMTVLGVFKPQN